MGQQTMDYRKKRRRRRANRQPISAWLTFSEKIKENVGLISDDLCIDLFHESIAEGNGSSNIRYVAISAWTPSSSNTLSGGSWTILPVLHGEENHFELPPSTIAFPPSSPALHSFAKAPQFNPAARSNSKGEKGIEIYILDVEPLNLDTIFVAVDGDALAKHDEVQKRFGGGFNHSTSNGFLSQGKAKGKAALFDAANSPSLGSDAQEQRLITVTRQALALSTLVRQGDLLSLPLPTHPITHASFPPAKIRFCEPVSQGLLTEATNIVICRTFHRAPSDRASVELALPKLTRGLIVKDNAGFTSDEDESANEQFYSAMEDKGIVTAPDSTYSSESSDSDTSNKGSGSQSDDSLDNIISLAAPGLPAEFSGFKSPATAATPRAFGCRPTGNDTPGSTYSNFTATTVRQGAGGGRVFRTRGLLSRVSENYLHPKPVGGEDEEARIFVDTKMLLKVGCFSGDWVKVEVMADHPVQWGLEAFEDSQGPAVEFRAVKVYGLPDLTANTKSRYPSSTANRQPIMAFGSPHERPASAAWFSPILLANLDYPSYVRLSPLSSLLQERMTPGHRPRQPKISHSSLPPVAKEVILSRIFTPVSTERALQTGLFASLTQHFENKRRILRKGDLVPLAIDVGVSRLLAQSTASLEVDRELEELLSLSSNELSQSSNLKEVAWFRVGQIINATSVDDLLSSTDIWGGVSCIEPLITSRSVQAGSEQSRYPPTMKNNWEYYLGVKAVPIFQFFPKVYSNFLTPPRSHIMSVRRRLRELIAAATSARARHFGMDPLVILLHSTQRNIGKATIAIRASSDLGMHVFSINAYDLLAEGGTGGSDVKTEGLLKARIERAMSCGSDCTTVLIRHVQALNAERMISTLKEVIKTVRVLIATTTELEKVSEAIRSIFTYELEVSAPDESEREGILRGIIEDRSVSLAHEVDLSSIATKSAALVAGDLVDIVERAVIARQERLESLLHQRLGHASELSNSPPLLRDLLVSGGESITSLTNPDFDLAIEAARKNFADSIGAPKIPSVSWADVGGLSHVKDAVMETIQLPLARPELFAKGMKKRSGILFYGPPGTGKTLLAKAIATEFSLNFFSVKGPELLNMYIGESEANVRRVFQRARDAKPCVVFFDELDSVAPKRGNQGDSGGVMDRIVSQLLAELDGISDSDGAGGGGGSVFVIGATNRPDLLDQALLRPGRFDKMLYLGVSDSHDKQLTILQALTRKFTLHPRLDLERVAQSLPFTYTGADMYALCSDAMLKAVMRQARQVDEKVGKLKQQQQEQQQAGVRDSTITTAWWFDHCAKEEDLKVEIGEDDFDEARRELVPSVR